MSLNHGFYIIREGEIKYSSCREYHSVKPDVEIHDDVIRYVYDTLSWVPCMHLSGSKYKHTKGLFLYGSTIINGEGAASLNHIMASWANLFSHAPKEFELRGSLILDADKKFTGKISKILVDRDELVEKLETLARYAEQSMSGEYYILHFGI